MDRFVDAIPQLWPIVVAAAGAVAWFMNRAERRQALLIEHIRAEKAEAEAERDVERAAKLRAEYRARSYWKQLVDHGITPDPEWGDEA